MPTAFGGASAFASLTPLDLECETLPVSEGIYLPITDDREINALVDELPIAVNREHFVGFVRGFPRSYLVNTPRVELVKHYLLRESLGDKKVISSLYRQQGPWKLDLITRDRRRLFSNITGTLSCFGMNITSAMAFSNDNLVVLDTFVFLDPHDHLGESKARESFQHLVEEVVEGTTEIQQLLAEHWSDVPFAEYKPFEVDADNVSHPRMTRLSLNCRDHVGLAYLLSDCIGSQGFSIEMAYIETEGAFSRQQYYICSDGNKLEPEQLEELRVKLFHLGEHLALEPDQY